LICGMRRVSPWLMELGKRSFYLGNKRYVALCKGVWCWRRWKVKWTVQFNWCR
jgi:hypothetical protein